MHERALRRAAMVAAAISLLVAAAAWADTVAADGDTTSGIQSTIDLGTTTAGSQIEVPVWFELTCKGLAHADPGQVLTISLASSTLPPGGSVSSGVTSIGPVPSGWPVDGEGCPTGLSIRSADPALVRLTMPPTAGPTSFTLGFSGSLAPAGSGDASAVSGLISITISATVVVDQPPVLELPAATVVEADGPSGAIVDFVVGVTDAEDDPAPSAVCTPGSGSAFPLGVTTVTCSATDSAGNLATGSFTVTVVDTTPPVISGPTEVVQWTTDPTGAPAAYPMPTAADAVDGAVPVTCLPAPGDWLLPGSSTVTCTATDAAANVATASFTLTLDVGAVPGSDPGSDPGPQPGGGGGPGDPAGLTPAFTVEFGPPVGADGVLRARLGRTVPLELRLFAGDSPVTDGVVELQLRDCLGASVGDPIVLHLSGGWWRGLLRTSGLPTCVDAVVLADGVEAGHLRLDLTTEAVAAGAPAASTTAGSDAAKAPAGKGRTTAPSASAQPAITQAPTKPVPAKQGTTKQTPANETGPKADRPTDAGADGRGAGHGGG
jgi:hypothetical protein